MSKSINTIIQPNGDVVADFSGFAGDDCVVEEERLRRELASLGLTLRIAEQQRHSRQAPDACIDCSPKQSERAV